ncbi:MAG: hypothetical protein QXU97_06010 [Fervidicoccaceae archaeon]
MPLVYRCKGCGYVLHYLRYVGQDYVGVPSVYEVLSRYGYVCPKCGSRLSRPSQEDVLITSADAAKTMGLLPVEVGGSFYVDVRARLAPKPLYAPAEAESSLGSDL